MPLFDMPLAELERYRPEPTAPDDVDAFWAETLDFARKHDLDPEFTPADFMLDTLDVLDASFSGWNGEKEIRVWPYNGHEGGEVFQHRDNLGFLRRHLA